MKKFIILISIIMTAGFGAIGQEIKSVQTHSVATTRPALKYRLTFAPEFLTGDNPKPLYEKANLAMKDTENAVDQIIDMAPGNWTADDVLRIRDLLKRVQPILDLAMQIGKCREYPADHLDFTSIQDLQGKINNVNDFKWLASLATAQAKSMAVEGRFDEAFEWIRVAMQIADQSASNHLLINAMVAEGIHGLVNKRLLEIIQLPGAPNIYWPLAQLRRPTIDISTALDTEISFISSCYKDILDPLTMTADQWQKFYVDFLRMTGQSSANDAKTKLGAAMYGALFEPSAREYMLKNGFTEKQLEKYDPVQIVGYYFIGSTRNYNDEIRKLIRLPYHQTHSAFAALKEEFDPEKSPRNVLLLLSINGETARKLLSNQAKIERDFSMLKNFEAIRNFAALHKNTLPKTLDEIKDLPLDQDPTTGKLFEWVIKSPKTGILSSPGEDGLNPMIQMSEIKLEIK